VEVCPLNKKHYFNHKAMLMQTLLTAKERSAYPMHNRETHASAHDASTLAASAISRALIVSSHNASTPVFWSPQLFCSLGLIDFIEHT
jgi:hypothetical protein